MFRISAFLFTITILSGCSWDQTKNDFKVFLFGISPKILEKLGWEPPVAGWAEREKTLESMRMNSELLAEMIQVVFPSKDPVPPEVFGDYLSTLQQGASLEGLYRGMISAARYRGLEGQAQAATPDQVRRFAVELATIQLEMQSPTAFGPDSKKPFEVQYPEDPAAANPNQPLPPDPKRLEKMPRSVEVLATDLIKTFVDATPYTLRRVLSEEVLKATDEFRPAGGSERLEDLAQWYGKTAQRMAGYQIDFGLKERNLPDFDFHAQWCRSHTLDRIKWELINRVHRLI